MIKQKTKQEDNFLSQVIKTHDDMERGFAGGYETCLLDLIHNLKDVSPFLLILLEPAIKDIQLKCLNHKKAVV